MIQGDTLRMTLYGGIVAPKEAQSDPNVVASTIHYNNLKLTQTSLGATRWPCATQGDPTWPKMGDSGRPKGAQGDSG